MREIKFHRLLCTTNGVLLRTRTIENVCQCVVNVQVHGMRTLRSILFAQELMCCVSCNVHTYTHSWNALENENFYSPPRKYDKRKNLFFVQSCWWIVAVPTFMVPTKFLNIWIWLSWSRETVAYVTQIKEIHLDMNSVFFSSYIIILSLNK